MKSIQYFDMVEFSSYGQACSRMFSVECLEDIQDVMNSPDTDKLDYNFLFGVKIGLLKRIETI